jgi:hypothetical protein
VPSAQPVLLPHAGNGLGALGAASLAPAISQLPLTSLNLSGTLRCWRPSIVAFRYARLLLCALCFLSAANGLEAAGSVALAATLPLMGRLLSLSLASKHREIAGTADPRAWFGKAVFGELQRTGSEPWGLRQ